MKEWLDIKDLLWIIMGMVGLLSIIIGYSIFRPKIKYLFKEDRYCIIWEKLQHYEQMGNMTKDRYELELSYIKLPIWFNRFKKK